jgi:hypothetical protein
MTRSVRLIVLWLALLCGTPALASQATLVTPGAPLPMTGLASFLNAALLSIGSCNSGNSAPANGPGSAAFAGECWINTTSNPWVFSYTPDATHWVTFGTLNTSTFVWTPYLGGNPISATPPLVGSVSSGVLTLALQHDSNFTNNGSNQLVFANIGSGDLLANAGASPAEPTDTTPTAWLNRWCSGTQFNFPQRGASTWACGTISGLLVQGTGISISGTGQVTIALANQIAAGGPTGTATAIPVLTYNAQGQLTAVSTTSVNPFALVPAPTNNAIYKGQGASAPVPSALSDDGTKVSSTEELDLTSQPQTTEIANATSTGTTANKIAKLTGAPSTAVITATTDISGAIGIVVGGAGATGNARIAIDGQASCVFDGATIAGDYVRISSITAGDCHDAGASYPVNVQTIGRVLSTNAAGGTYAVALSPTGEPALGTFATQNFATPPPIGGTTPNAGTFSSLTDTGITGSTQCAQFNSSGLLGGTGNACGGAGSSLLSGTVLAKTGAYTAVTGDCGDTITLGNNSQYALTINAVGTYASNCGFLVENIDTIGTGRTKTLTVNGVSGLRKLYPGETALIYSAGTGWAVKMAPRWRATTATPFCIWPTGSDSNDGLGTPGTSTCFQTATACETAISTDIDINGRTDVGCNHSCAGPPCNITSNSQFLSLTGGTTFVGGAPYYKGDCSTPTNVKLNPGAATTADIQITLEISSVPIQICGFELAGGANVSYGVYAGGSTNINMMGLWQCDTISATAATGYPAGACMEANSTAKIYFNANFATTGSVGAVFSETNGGYLEVGSAIIATGAASLTWAQGYAYCQFGGACALGSITFTGYSAITGAGCNVGRSASMNINAAAAGYFPNGGVTCSIAGGGVSDSAGNRGAIL